MKRVVTQETRDKISKSLKGVSVSPATQFKKGQKPSPLAIEKNRQRCGEKSPSWKGGKIQKECVVKNEPHYLRALCWLVHLVPLNENQKENIFFCQQPIP